MPDPKVCISLAARSAAEIERRLCELSTHRGYVEIRLDAAPSDERERFAARFDRATLRPSIIATLRPAEQGGLRNIDRDERIAFWRKYADRFEIIDVECDITAEVHHSGRRIVSRHFLERTHPDLTDEFRRLADLGADIVKIAVAADYLADATDVWKLLDAAVRAENMQHAEANVPVIPIAMGESGRWTRILGPAYGGYLTYASDTTAEPTAAGQYDAATMTDLFRIDAISRQTAIYGIIGQPVNRSLSPWMHNAAFAATGIDAVFVPIETATLDPVFSGLIGECGLPIAGLSVTMPHKVAVIEHLDQLDETAAAIRAVNTVKRSPDGNSIGFNTDAIGFERPLRRVVGDLSGLRVAIAGGGGAARACVHTLASAGAEPVLFVRDTVKTAENFPHCDVRDISKLAHEIANFDIFVNATSIGMSGNNDRLPVNESHLGGLRCVFDLVTRPDDSELIAAAKRNNVPSISGFEMLVEQGVAQFEIWTGCDAPRDIMERAARRRLAEIS